MSLNDLVTFFNDSKKIEQIRSTIEENFKDDKDRETILAIIVEFVRYFALFRDLRPLQLELHQCILDAIKMVDHPLDLGELLQKSILLRLVEIYIEYAGFEQKEKILNILSTSLETLAAGPLFLNLGLLVRPIFQQESYQRAQEAREEREIVYSVEYKTTSTTDLEIKQVMDRWIKNQRIDLDAQDKIKHALKEKFQQECRQRGVPARDDLLFQVEEMLNMQFTLASLDMSLGEEDITPTPIH